MKSDVITISNQGHGFKDAVEQARKVAVYNDFDQLKTVALQLLTEEMLSLARSITGEMKASFWIEVEAGQAALHMTTNTVMDLEKRNLLISAATSRKNEAATTFLGKLRDSLEQAMLSEKAPDEVPEDVLVDLPHGIYGVSEWDGFEKSILRQLADDVKIGIRGNLVEITVSKRFDE